MCLALADVSDMHVIKWEMDTEGESVEFTRTLFLRRDSVLMGWYELTDSPRYTHSSFGWICVFQKYSHSCRVCLKHLTACSVSLSIWPFYFQYILMCLHLTKCELNDLSSNFLAISYKSVWQSFLCFPSPGPCDSTVFGCLLTQMVFSCNVTRRTFNNHNPVLLSMSVNSC